MRAEDVLAEVLPLFEAPFSLELEPGGLRYRGVERPSTYWGPSEPLDVDALLPFPTLTESPRLEASLRAWGLVLREVFAHFAKHDAPSLAARQVLDEKALRAMVEDLKVSEADFAQRWRWNLAAALPPLPELLAARDALVAYFAEHGSTFVGGPTQDGHHATLEYVEPTLRSGHLFLVLRLVVWELDGENRSIRDVKEQEVCFLSPGPGLAPTRVTNYLAAFSECMSAKFAQLEPDTLMPHDLVISPQQYKSGQTVDDFRKLLRRKLHL